MVDRWAARVRIACGVGVLASLALALFAGRHWPLVGDAALMHFVVFSLEHGKVLYRDLPDVNLPGTYFFEALGMHLFGAGAIGWRIYDASLLIMLTAATYLLGHNCGARFAGLTAGAFFALIHLQDGILQAGQRDLLMAVLLLWSYGALFAAQAGRHALAMTYLFGFAIGTSGTIKPVLLPLGLVLLLMLVWQLKYRQISCKVLASGTAGILTPLLLTAFWVFRNGALDAFLHRSKALILLHASLGRLPLAYLLTHMVAPVGFLVVALVILLASERNKVSPFRQQLYVGLAGTAFAFLSQGKGLPYQRYPFLALFLFILAIDLDRMLSSPKWRSYAAATILLVMAFILAPTYCRTATTFSPSTPFQTALGDRLDRLQVSTSLSGEVQCLDTFGGCLGVLYEHKLLQSTGFLYDCYLFSPPSATRDRYRADFLAALRAHPPKVVIATDQFCFRYAGGFSRIEQWPELNDLLARDYLAEPVWKSAELQHWWHRREMPVEFRLYRRRN